MSRLAINIFIILFIGGFIVLNVFVTPKDILFGVRIPSEKQLIPEVKDPQKVHNRYGGDNHHYANFSLCAISPLPPMVFNVSINSPLIILLVFLFIYFLSWKRAKN